jgi:phage regulator Rha-like protein
MLTGSRFVQMTADFVRRFAELGDCMLIYTEPSVFDETLEIALRGRDASSG